MESLATVDDVAERLGRDITVEEGVKLPALLRDASSNVRRISTQQFTAGSSVSTLKLSSNGRVRLPQRPVTAINSVRDGNGVDVAYTQVGAELRLSFVAINAWEMERRWMPVEHVIVDYDHGGTVPDMIIGIVCSIATRALGQDPSTTGVVQESIDGYSYSTGSAAAQGGFGLLASEREVCESFKRATGQIAML